MVQEHKLLIDGERVDAEEIREIKSPYDQKTVGKVHFADKLQVEKAVGAAHRAFQETRRLSSYDRARFLEAVSDKIGKNQEELARSIALCAGKPIKSSRVEVDRAVSTFAIAAEEAKRMTGEIVPLDLSPQTANRWGLVRRFPVGPVAGITPFNFPLNLVAHKVAPAMASGNTVLLRPASQVSITSGLLSDLIDGTDYPAGGFNFIPCGYEAADVLLDDDRIKKITVIEPDANLDFALPRTVLGAYSYSGQICISIQRIYLHEEIYDKFMSDFLDATKKLKIGDPMNEDTDVGPMINQDAAKQTEEWVQEALENGAHLICGGQRDGAVYAPTILEKVKPELRISWLEAFAPVVVVYPYKDFEKALEGVNYSIYGLQAGIFSNDLKKAFHAYEVLDVGGVILNDIPTFRIDHMPYGGVKESGFGREGLKYAVEEMTELKLLAINLNV